MRLSVHRLVAIAFLGNPPPAHQVAHADGDKTNNHVNNLRWATCRENILDKQVHGTQARGETQGSAKLTSADVLAIRASTESGPKAGSRYGISSTQVYRLRKLKSWSHV